MSAAVAAVQTPPRVIQQLPTEAIYVAQTWWPSAQAVCHSGKATELGTGSDAGSDTRS